MANSKLRKFTARETDWMCRALALLSPHTASELFIFWHPDIYLESGVQKEAAKRTVYQRFRNAKSDKRQKVYQKIKQYEQEVAAYNKLYDAFPFLNPLIELCHLTEAHFKPNPSPTNSQDWTYLQRVRKVAHTPKHPQDRIGTAPLNLDELLTT